MRGSQPPAGKYAVSINGTVVGTMQVIGELLADSVSLLGAIQSTQLHAGDELGLTPLDGERGSQDGH